MTNGEKLKEVFPSIELYEKSHDGIQIDFNSVWWNAEYKEPSSSEKPNKSEIPTGSTTENDLGIDFDCISRFSAKQIIRNHYCSIPSKAFKKLIEELDSLSPVTPIIPKGHWITKDGKEQGYDIAGVKTWYIQIICSECGFIKPAIEGHTEQYHFCPRCGAEMRGEEE